MATTCTSSPTQTLTSAIISTTVSTSFTTTTTVIQGSGTPSTLCISSARATGSAFTQCTTITGQVARTIWPLFVSSLANTP
ncbi:hypothetical protein L218DRAFT_955575 [Marasmius fiardii PR-910]|nr:hypothetical protein L218DRAFT_955575 [Marasmius fiardii PR-910]